MVVVTGFKEFLCYCQYILLVYNHKGYCSAVSLFTAVANIQSKKHQMPVRKQENSSSEDASSEDEKPRIPQAKSEYI